MVSGFLFTSFLWFLSFSNAQPACSTQPTNTTCLSITGCAWCGDPNQSGVHCYDTATEMCCGNNGACPSPIICNTTSNCAFPPFCSNPVCCPEETVGCATRHLVSCCDKKSLCCANNYYSACCNATELCCIGSLPGDIWCCPQGSQCGSQGCLTM